MIDLDEAEGWFAYWETVGSRADDTAVAERAAATALHSEYDRRGAALAERDAEITRLRAAARVWRDVADGGRIETPEARSQRATLRCCADEVLRVLAAAPAPAPAKVEKPRCTRCGKAAMHLGHGVCNTCWAWAPAPAREQTVGHVPELIARCDGVDEQDGSPCTGLLRYRWGQVESACDTCGGYCGIAVARWAGVAWRSGPGTVCDDR